MVVDKSWKEKKIKQMTSQWNYKDLGHIAWKRKTQTNESKEKVP